MNEPEFMPRSDLLLKAPAYPYTANQVFRQIKEALDEVATPRVQPLTLKQLGHLIGAPRSTLHDWYHGDLPKPIKHFLCALERLSQERRAVLIGKLCRDFPQLEHQRLAHDEQSVKALSALISQKTGLTFIAGPNDASRSFLITAIGNTAAQALATHAITGLDVHRPDNFVPVPGVLYFRRPEHARRERLLVEQLWSHVEHSTATLVLLNGVLSITPGLLRKIEALAKRKHLIVADEFQAKPEVFSNVIGTIVTVAVMANRLLHVRLQTAQPDY